MKEPRQTSEVFSSHIFGDLQRFGERAFGLGEGLGVVVVGVGFSVFPHLEEDADPLEGEGSDGGLVFHAGGFFGLVEGFSRIDFFGGHQRRVWSANSWKVCLRNWGQAWRLWTDLDLPLCWVTGAMPLWFWSSVADW